MPQPPLSSLPASRALALVLAAWLGAACAPRADCVDDEGCANDQRCVAGACERPAADGAVRVLSFDARPTTVAAGGVATLSWSTQHAASCSLDPGFGTVPRSGSVEVQPSATTTWTLACEGKGGPAEADATVAVLAADGGLVDAGALDGGALDAGGGDGGSDGGSDGGDAGAPVPEVVVSGSVELMPAPSSIDDTVGAGGVILFAERQGVELAEWVMADSTYPASWGSAQDLGTSEPRVQLVTGQVLDSWMLHILNPSGTEPVEGTLTFAREIVAIIWRGGTLDETDALFAAPGTTYSALPDREFALWGQDWFTLSDDRRSIRFSAIGSNIDELRVLVNAADGVPPMVQTWTLDPESAGPLDLTADGRSDATHALLLAERSVTLDSALPIEISTAGRYPGATPVPGSLPAGTTVQSWLVHFDPPESDGGAPSLTGTVTFERPILGVIAGSAALLDSDSVFGLPDVTFGAGDARGVELDLGDSVWWSGDGRTLRVDLAVPAGGISIDQLRVLTEP